MKSPDIAGSLLARLWRYQAERFPLANHGAMTTAFAASACAFAAAMVAPGHWPSTTAILLATIAGLGQFALLRIADEHKDFDTDLAHRPYRPVPRGLISLAELRWVGLAAAALMALAVVLAQSVALGVLMLILWATFALMSAEFFVPAWLKRRPLLYLASHMLIMPLIAWMLAGFQLAHDGVALTALPLGAGAFLACVFLVGIVLELGRKVRAEPDEEKGVETYSALWGSVRARNAWLAAALAAAAASLIAIAQIGGSLIVALAVSAAGLAVAAVSAYRFAPVQAGAGKRIEQASGAFALAILVALGAAPHIEALP